MKDDLFVAIAAGVAAVTLTPSLLALRCNVRRLRAARTTAPLDGIDLHEATVRPYAAPKTWPIIEEVSDPAVAAAYAEFADDLALALVVVGDVVTIVGSAAAGATIAGIWGDGPWWAVLPAFLVAGLGVFVRLLAVRKWEVLRVRYLDRHAELMAEPLLPQPARRRGLFGWRR
jgi:hypothetical protein